MSIRGDLQTILEGFCENVYFQPPESIKLSYPCIIYKRDTVKNQFADDFNYINKKGYQVMVIDPDPDSEISDLIAELPLCSFQRYYVVNNLNHDVFILYF